MSKGLRALERLKPLIEVNIKHWKQDVGYIEKELKALEIIKKYIDIEYWTDLTQEEYDLLKEVLL